MSDVNAEVAELVLAIRSNLLVLEGVGFWVPHESKDQYDDVLSEIKSHVDCIQSLPGFKPSINVRTAKGKLCR